MAPNRTLIQITSLGGHRASYLQHLKKVLGGQRVQSPLRMVTAREPVLFATLEGSFLLYSLVAPIRSLTRRRTVGLLLRPGPTAHGRTFRLRLKRWILKFLRRFSYVRTLTILPFSLDSAFASVAHGWIYDPQLWDLTDAERQHVADGGGGLAERTRAAAGARRVCVALGRQDRAKGFDKFAECYLRSPHLRDRFLFVSGGKVSPECAAAAHDMSAAGGRIEDRYLDAQELLDLYAAADLVWCHYHPDYDQASGVLGRAVQLGLPVVVRAGSYVETLCRLEGFPHVVLDSAGDCRTIEGAPGRLRWTDADAHANRMRRVSVMRLREGLGYEA